MKSQRSVNGRTLNLITLEKGRMPDGSYHLQCVSCRRKLVPGDSKTALWVCLRVSLSGKQIMTSQSLIEDWNHINQQISCFCLLASGKSKKTDKNLVRATYHPLPTHTHIFFVLQNFSNFSDCKGVTNTLGRKEMHLDNSIKWHTVGFFHMRAGWKSAVGHSETLQTFEWLHSCNCSNKIKLRQRLIRSTVALSHFTGLWVCKSYRSPSWSRRELKWIYIMCTLKLRVEREPFT